ncbi:RNA polymerase sigma factor [Caulobacter mirabilis]|nr:sigma-70 family RNA polymerase sigma factor [Caulobacter mirabilis]
MSPPRMPIAAPQPDDLSGWVARYEPALRRYFQRKVGTSDADDLVQEVFMSLQVRSGSEAPIENIEGYIFRTAANVVARRHRRRTWDWSEHDPLDGVHDPGDEVSPERVLLDKEALARVLAAMQALPPRCSEAFMLHRFEEMTYAAIAVRMRISKKAVEHLIQRALRRISLSLDPDL